MSSERRAIQVAAENVWVVDRFSLDFFWEWARVVGWVGGVSGGHNACSNYRHGQRSITKIN